MENNEFRHTHFGKDILFFLGFFCLCIIWFVVMGIGLIIKNIKEKL